MPISRARTVVLGLGNPVLSDDSIGLKVAQHLRELLAERPIPGVSAACSTRAGFEMLDLLTGYERAVIVDALVLPEPTPGRVHRLDLANLSGMARLVGSHDLSLTQAFQLAEFLHIPMPSEVIILGVEPAEVHQFSEEMTPPVARIVDPLAKKIHGLLGGGDALVEGDDGNELHAFPMAFSF